VASDAELLTQWAKGDAAAGRAFYRRFCDALAEFVSRRVEGDAADLVQRIFLACLKARKSGTAVEQPRAFLYAIARNEIYDVLKARRRDAAMFDPAVTSLRELGPSPTSVLAADERQRMLHEALEEIPLDAQLALELYYWEDMSMQEVATVLGITKSAALNRVHRARALLRERIAERPAGTARQSTLDQLQAWPEPPPEGDR